MDLRKAILLKKPLQDSFNSLNSSGASVYESAAEDSDSSLLYYSFTNQSSKSFEGLNTEDEENHSDLENSLVSETDNKENTIIMREPIETNEKVIEKPEKIEDVEIKLEDVLDVKQEIIPIENPLPANPSNNEPFVFKATKIDTQKTEFVIPEIRIEDPNENLINPFTFPIYETNSTEIENVPMECDDERESIEVDHVTMRKVAEANKKSASRIPMKTHFYSPLQRKSIDKRTKVITKPLTRRTIYETRSQAVKPKPKTSILPPVEKKRPAPKPKTSILPPVETKKPALKPKTSILPPVEKKKPAPQPVDYKCTFSGCIREFRSLKMLQDHAKSHKTNNPSTSSSSSSSFKCKWCDKVFELNTALSNHMSDKCLKIPFGEKRKLLAQRDKSKEAVDNKRKSVFVAPQMPKKRSPKRQTLNKSGIMITPKKPLTCECGKIFTSVLEFAHHTVAHKYEGALQHAEN